MTERESDTDKGTELERETISDLDVHLEQAEAVRGGQKGDPLSEECSEEGVPGC